MDKRQKQRKYAQLFFALLFNANLAGFFTGTLYRGSTKGICVPGLNCYSCPAAIGACPVGSLQAAFSEAKHQLPLYMFGVLLLFGVLLGRTLCAFLCPFGLLQEALFRIRTKKISKGKWSARLSLFRYPIFAVFVVGLPLGFSFADLAALPAFCKFICPAGTLEGGLPLLAAIPLLRESAGLLFSWKLMLLILFLVASVFVYRPFCRFVCPLGLITGWFHKISILGYRRDTAACIGCGNCEKICKLDVKIMNDATCIRCGECVRVCPADAVKFFPSSQKEGSHEKNA